MSSYFTKINTKAKAQAKGIEQEEAVHLIVPTIKSNGRKNFNA
jgi:hypothetical protein